MTNNYSPSSRQLHWNLYQHQAQLAIGLTTKETSNLIKIVAGEEISVETVRNHAKEGFFEIPYSYGKLIITLSSKGKQSKRYSLDVQFSPLSFTSK